MKSTIVILFLSACSLAGRGQTSQVTRQIESVWTHRDTIIQSKLHKGTIDDLLKYVEFCEKDSMLVLLKPGYYSVRKHNPSLEDFLIWYAKNY